MDQPICDFCSEPAPAWCYSASNFVAMTVGPVIAESEGNWAACDECHRLIEDGDRTGLAQRSASLLIVISPQLACIAGEIQKDLAELHAAFFEHRRGACVPMPNTCHT